MLVHVCVTTKCSAHDKCHPETKTFALEWCCFKGGECHFTRFAKRAAASQVYFQKKGWTNKKHPKATKWYLTNVQTHDCIHMSFYKMCFQRNHWLLQNDFNFSNVPQWCQNWQLQNVIPTLVIFAKNLIKPLWATNCNDPRSQFSLKID